MSIQEQRHAARDNVTTALKALQITPEEDYGNMVGMCQHILMLTGGQPGMPKDTQVEVLEHFITDLDKVMEDFTEKIEKSRASIIAQAQTLGDGALEALTAAKAAAEEAKSLAISRDFEAHQEEKAKLREEAAVLAFNEQIDTLSESGEMPEAQVVSDGTTYTLMSVDLKTGQAKVQKFDNEEDAAKALNESMSSMDEKNPETEDDD